MMGIRLGLCSAGLILLLAGCSNDKPAPPPDETPPSSEETHEDDAIKMNGTVFTKREMEFYTLMQKIFIERNRAEDLKEGHSSEEDIHAYWDAQKEQYDNVNVQLQTLIELHAMALLAEEKGYYIPPENVEANVKKVEQLVEEEPAIKQLAEDYGQDDFDVEIFPYMKEYLLKQRILGEIEKDIRADKPDAPDTEVAYETRKMYEDLYEDQVSGMELEIYLK